MTTAAKCTITLFLTLGVSLARASLPEAQDAAADRATPAGGPQPFARYQVILDRKPFGVAPVAGPEAAAAVAPDAAQQAQKEQALARQISMVAVNITPEGKTVIGFIDNAEKPPRNYCLGVGESSNGFTVEDASCADETATLSKDGVAITIQLGKGVIPKPAGLAALPRPGGGQPSPASPAVAPAAGAGAAVAPTPAGPGAALQVRPGIIRRPDQLNAGDMERRLADMQQRQAELRKLRESGGDVRSYISQLRDRKRAERQAQEAAEKSAREEVQALAEKMSQEELKRRERELNLKLIEQGARPISDIELTPEEDADLVRRGLLP
ncbi:MAG: hypothetical protein PHR35_04240 [Kiritimatiellae bacterium]|nr:hypothetical protein [Kiritimatiellia bacterium]